MPLIKILDQGARLRGSPAIAASQNDLRTASSSQDAKIETMTVDRPHNMFFDAFAFMLNVASSVLIIFVNKQLMRPLEAGGAGFNFCTCCIGCIR